MFDFILQNVSFCIQIPQRVVHTPSIFYADSFIGCLSLISSGTARKVKVGPTAAADCPPTSPLAAAWRSPLLRLEHGPQVTKSHKKSQKVTTNLLQPTTPLSLFLNTTETSATPVQRSVTPLLFPEHRLQSPVTPG